jgi:hypothetical protein
LCNCLVIREFESRTCLRQTGYANYTIDNYRIA